MQAVHICFNNKKLHAFKKKKNLPQVLAMGICLALNVRELWVFTWESTFSWIFFLSLDIDHLFPSPNAHSCKPHLNLSWGISNNLGNILHVYGLLF